MKKNRGITMVALVITIVVLLIIAGISIGAGNNAIKNSKLENLKTNMLLIEVKAKEQIENAKFRLGTSFDKATEEEKTNRVNTAKSEFTGDEIVDGDIFNNNTKITTEKIKEDNKNNIYYYKLSTPNLIDMGLKNVKSDEKNGYYIVKYNLKESTIEIYNTEGFDDEGNLFCNQRYGDWPQDVERLRKDPWAEPEWFLLSYGAKITASGYEKNHEPSLAADENVQTWWIADTEAPGSFLTMDLDTCADVHAIQINFADDPSSQIKCPGEWKKTPDMDRYIDRNAGHTRWLLEGSSDGERWFVLEDKRNADTDLSHDLVVSEEGWKLQYLKLTIEEVPYHVKPCISGLRVFGKTEGTLPEVPEYEARRTGHLDMEVSVKEQKAVSGYQILWGNKPEQLYHSCMVMGNCKNYRVGALVKGKAYYVRVDAFNGAGISHGTVKKIEVF